MTYADCSNFNGPSGFNGHNGRHGCNGIMAVIAIMFIMPVMCEITLLAVWTCLKGLDTLPGI